MTKPTSQLLQHKTDNLWQSTLEERLAAPDIAAAIAITTMM